MAVKFPKRFRRQSRPDARHKNAAIAITGQALLSQAEVAEILGITRGGVSMAENVALRKIAAAIEREASKAGTTVRGWLYGD